MDAGLTRFVPIRRHELAPRLAADRDDGPAFTHAADLLHHLIRYEADAEACRLHETYAAFDPDPLVPSLRPADGDEAAFLDAAEAMLERANFRPVGDDELREAFGARSLFPLHVQVDLDEYAVLRVYRRGLERRTEKIRGWRTLWRWKKIELDMYERLVVVLRMRPRALQRKRHMGMVGLEPERIYLKSFKNVPRADLEMVLPNTRLRMRLLDKLLVGGPLAVGVGWTLATSASIILAVLAGGFALSFDDGRLRALGGILLVLAGYLWRTLAKIKTTRLEYLKTLSEGLYFRNLANNRAVLDQTLAFAADEEEKEALLAYHFLTLHGPQDAESLDQRAEEWVTAVAGRRTDFDVHDGLATLRRLGVASDEDGVWSALAPAEAARVLDERWDGAFSGAAKAAPS